MFSIICSSQSTKREQKHSPKDKSRSNSASLRFPPLLAGLLFLLSITGAHAAAPSTEDSKAKTRPLGIFNSLELRTNAKTDAGQWDRVLTRMRHERERYADCASAQAPCGTRARKWLNLVASLKGQPERQILVRVNSAANQLIPYASDRRAFRRNDYWASPLESLSGRGDCEDYAILKYASLRELGFSEERLRIVVLNDTARGLGHAVLSVRLGAEIYVLDNQLAQPTLHSQLTHYKPVYSLNARGRWLNLATRPAKARLVASLDDTIAVTAPQARAKAIVLPRPKPVRVVTALPRPEHARQTDGLAMTALAQPIRLAALPRLRELR